MIKWVAEVLGMSSSPTKWADQAHRDYGGGDRGQRAYDAIMARDNADRKLAYDQKTWDPTHYADKAFQETGGWQAVYDAIMDEPADGRFDEYMRVRGEFARAKATPLEGRPTIAQIRESKRVQQKHKSRAEKAEVRERARAERAIQTDTGGRMRECQEVNIETGKCTVWNDWSDVTPAVADRDKAAPSGVSVGTAVPSRGAPPTHAAEVRECRKVNIETGKCTEWNDWSDVTPAVARVEMRGTGAGSGIDPTPAPLPLPTISGITFEKTSNDEKFWGCAIPGDARVSTDNRKDVEALCAENAACVGYYDGGPWFIATDTEPARCTTKGKEVYPHFYRKKVFVQTPNEIGVWGCQIPGNDRRSSTNVQRDVEAMCRESAACKGYYGNDVGSWFIATGKTPAECPAESRHATEKYPFFYKKGK